MFTLWYRQEYFNIEVILMNKSIDFKSPIPLHLQVKLILEDEIMKNQYEGKIPGELELMERFSVSRSTIRQALRTLVDEGLLEKHHGKGTFVSLKPVTEWLGSFSPYDQIIRDMGMEPNIKLIKQHFTTSPKEIGEMLDSDEFYHIQRIRYANNIPIGIENQFYSFEIGKKVSQYELNDESTYHLLEDEIGFKLWEAEQIITARKAEPEECKLLEIPESLWLLFIERNNYNQSGELIEYEQSVYRPDMYAFVVNFNRKRN